MEKENSFMQTKPVFSLLLSMSVPMMLSMLIQSLYNIVDSIYVSRLGTDALTAVSLAYPLQNAILSVAVGIGVGISSAISIHLGAGNREKAYNKHFYIFHNIHLSHKEYISKNIPIISVLFSDYHTNMSIL